MATVLKIGLSGNKKKVAPLWRPAILELKDRDSGKVSQFTLQDFERHGRDNPEKGICYFEIPDVLEGRYDVTIRDIHTFKRGPKGSGLFS